MRWKVALPDLGNSTPVVVRERLFLTVAIDLAAPTGGTPEAPAYGPQAGPPNAAHAHAHRSIVLALDRATGRELWRTTVHEGVPHERCHATGSHASASPVVGGVAYVTNAYMGNAIQALRLASAKGALEARQALLWARKGVGSYVPTPIVHGGRIYFLRESSGVLSCLDAATGAPVHEGRRLADVRTVHSSPVLVPAGGEGRIHHPARDGTTVVVKAGDTFEMLATNRLDDVFDASPVIVASELCLRGRNHRYCICEPR